MRDTVNRYGRIWQTGSWQRSVANFHHGCELVRNGRIGKVTRVEVGLPTGGGSDNKPVHAGAAKASTGTSGWDRRRGCRSAASITGIGAGSWTTPAAS